jgi:Hemerythrin HHE cation binding domain
MENMILLRLEHKRIASMAADLAAMVDQPTPADPVRLLAFRREFARTLGAHLAREDWVIYPSLLTDARPQVRALARELADDAHAFTTAFRDYCRHWTTTAIAADWRGFGKATLAVLARLKNRVDVEDRNLYPLVADVEDEPVCAVRTEPRHSPAPPAASRTSIGNHFP